MCTSVHNQWKRRRSVICRGILKFHFTARLCKVGTIGDSVLIQWITNFWANISLQNVRFESACQRCLHWPNFCGWPLLLALRPQAAWRHQAPCWRQVQPAVPLHSRPLLHRRRVESYLSFSSLAIQSPLPLPFILQCSLAGGRGSPCISCSLPVFSQARALQGESAVQLLQEAYFCIKPCSSWKNSRRWIEVRGDLSVCDQEPRHYGQAQAVRRVPQVHFCCTISHARWLLLMLNVVHYSMNLSRLTSRMFDCQALDH